MLTQIKSGMKIFKVAVDETPIMARYAQSVPAGFPSPPADYTEEEINFNTLLMPHPNATFVMKVQGDSMIEANIPHDSLLLNG